MKQGMIGRLIAFMTERANAAMDPARQSNQSQTERAIRKIVYLLGGGAAAIVVFAMNRCSLGQFFASASVGLLAAGASCLVGATLGFLFGVPKSAGPKEAPPPGENESQASPRAGGPAFESNTNLEQISDWLTKILVGVALTQFDAIADRLGGMAKIVTEGLMAGGGCQGDRAAAYPVVGLAIILGFTLCGFLLTYLWTRRYLMREFVKAEEEATLRARAEAAEDSLAAMARVASKGTFQGSGGAAPLPMERVVRFAAPLDLGFEKMEGAVPSPSMEGGIVPGPDPGDPWKGAFGGEALVLGYRLEAAVSPMPSVPGRYLVKLGVRAEDPKAKPLRGKVAFYLHPTFTPQIQEVRVAANGAAELPLVAWGAFTVGALTEDGTRLELDLAEQESAPAEFRLR